MASHIASLILYAEGVTPQDVQYGASLAQTTFVHINEKDNYEVRELE
jgi:hypothetical protein